MRDSARKLKYVCDAHGVFLSNKNIGLNSANAIPRSCHLQVVGDSSSFK